MGAAWFAACVIHLSAQPGSTRPPDLAQIGKPDAAAARVLLERFRNSGPSGDYFVEFELHFFPRRGEGAVFKGQLWSSRNDQGPVSRVQLKDAAGRTFRWLLQNGSPASVWRLADGKALPLPAEELLTPLIPGINLSAFDLLMPYLYWPNFELTRIDRVRGRPAHTFVFRPPVTFARAHPEVALVRAYLDTQFNVLMQAEQLDPSGRILTSFSLGELKKVGEQWMLKSIDLRNESTRDKTRFLVTAAGLSLEFSAGLFEPARLIDDVPPPPASGLVRFAQ
jgi:hypothetical protein